MINSIGDKLKLNPLLLSLFAISPADALEYLDIQQLSSWIEVRRASSDADCTNVAQILDALRSGQTSMESRQQIEEAPRASEVWINQLSCLPVAILPDRQAAQVHKPAAPDITLIVALTTLQYALQHYAQHQFLGRPFQLDPQPWLDVW